MRCVACDRLLETWEATNKSVFTGAYLDLCKNCLSETEIVGTKQPPVVKEEEDGNADSEVL